MTVITSNNFVPAAHLPIRPIQISAGQAYGVMLDYKGSALLFADNDVVLYCVTAQCIKASLDIFSEEVGLTAATLVPITRILSRYLDKAPLFRDNVLDRCRNMSEVPDDLRKITVVEIKPVALLFNELEPKNPEELTGRMVRNADGQPIGWYFTDRTLSDMIKTPPPTYTCGNDSSHVTGPDHGSCQVCGGTLS